MDWITENAGWLLAGLGVALTIFVFVAKRTKTKKDDAIAETGLDLYRAAFGDPFARVRAELEKPVAKRVTIQSVDEDGKPKTVRVTIKPPKDR